MSFKATSRPLRCTSLHQSSLPDQLGDQPGSLSRSLPRENSLSSPIDTSSEEDSDDFEVGISEGLLSRKESGEVDEHTARSNANASDDANCDTAGAEAGRRRPVRSRRKSSISQLRQRPKGLPFSTLTTFSAIDAIEEKLIKDAGASSRPVTPEARRATYLAELPAAVEEIRRVSYRRTAMLPKTKSFNRVKASLTEEAAPQETDVRKEARLAEILKSKLDDGDEPAVDAMADIMEPHCDPARAKELVPSLSPSSNERSSSGRAHHHSLSTHDSSDDMIFHMQEISPTSGGFVVGDVPLGEMRQQRPASTHAKRKFDDSFDDCSAIKRRAVSPSISSPLNSPPVKGGGIFRIEDLTL